jgi:pyruvate dehydrogenase complex dehydrogenase (E1) component
MKKALLYIIYIFVITNCTIKNKSSKLEEIVNDNFLYFTDTIAYKSHSLITPFIDSGIQNFKKDFELIICINSKIQFNEKLNKYLAVELEKRDNQEYLKLLHEKPVRPYDTINIPQITRTGKYIIQSQEKCDNQQLQIVGSMQFFQPRISVDKAIIYLLKQSSLKAGVINSYLLKKIKQKWQTIETIEIERW